MANLPEVSSWDAGVHQLETNELVLGGPTGPANYPGINLTNRTLWLKDQLATIKNRTEVVQTTTGIWNCPAGITQVEILDLVGGGGGGWGPTFANGWGGGEGCRIKNVFLTVVPGQAYNLTIGAGGVATVSDVGGAPGGNGGTTSFGVLISAPGGNGGPSLALGGGAQGGQTTFNGITYAGFPAGTPAGPESSAGASLKEGGGLGGSRLAGGSLTTPFSGGGGHAGGGAGSPYEGPPTDGASGYIKFAY